MNNKLSVASWIHTFMFLIVTTMLLGKVIWSKLKDQEVNFGLAIAILLLCFLINSVGEWIADSTRSIAKVINILMLSLGGVYTLIAVRFTLGLSIPALRNMLALGVIYVASAVVLLGVGGAIEARFERNKTAK